MYNIQLSKNIVLNPKDGDVIKIFEEPQFRKMYKERYGHKLQLSKTEIDKVYTDIERKFII